jgi:hypothetical protein
MKHTEFREKLHLMAAGELDHAERKAIEDHLLTCSDCRDELARLTRLSALVAGSRPAFEVNETLLHEARIQLREALRQERFRRRFWETIEERLSGFIAPRFQVALGAAAMMAAGVFIGRMVFIPSVTAPQQSLSAEAQSIPGDTRITNVKFLDSGQSSGMVEFTFDAVRPVKMMGSVNDPQIQKVLTHAMLNDDNPGVRLRAVNAITAPRVEQPDNELKAALILALKTDPNAGVRREALNALQRYPPDNAVKNALLHTLLTDKNPGLRIAAINGFDSLRARGQSADQSIVSALRNRMLSDDNTYIRMRAKTVLQEAREQ